MGERCELCRFWLRAGRFGDECHRNAPVAIDRVIGWKGEEEIRAVMASWPNAVAHDWCGEFEPRAPDPTRGAG